MKSWSSHYKFSVLLLLGVFAAAASSADEEIWRTNPHHLSIVILGSDDRDATAFTLGADYEYRVNEILGLGFVVEHAFEDIDATTLLATADIHVWQGLAFQTGPGVEFVDGEDDEGREEEFTYRIGALYEFEFGRFTISPQIHYDFTTGADSLVFGGAVGFAF